MPALSRPSVLAHDSPLDPSFALELLEYQKHSQQYSILKI